VIVVFVKSRVTRRTIATGLVPKAEGGAFGFRQNQNVFVGALMRPSKPTQTPRPAQLEHKYDVLRRRVTGAAPRAVERHA
jgi:hypothetical protein